jgi:hypothetical protein
MVCSFSLLGAGKAHFIGETAFTKRYAERPEKVPGIYEEKGVGIFCKGADQELEEIAILVLERNGATVVLK